MKSSAVPFHKRVTLVFRDITYVIIILYSWYLVIYEHFWVRMCGTINPVSYIRWVLGFGIKIGNDTSTGAIKHFFSCDTWKISSTLAMVVAGQICKPRSHISQGWQMVRCSEALTFLSPQTSLHLSLARHSSTHDFHLRTPRVGASCLHRSLGVTMRLSSFLGYD
jgi:hypothetical protein